MGNSYGRFLARLKSPRRNQLRHRSHNAIAIVMVAAVAEKDAGAGPRRGKGTVAIAISPAASRTTIGAVATTTEINRIVMQVDRRIEAAAAAEADRPGRVQIRLRTEIEIAHRDAAKARTIDRPRRADVSLPGNVARVRTTGTRGRPGARVAMGPGIRVDVGNKTRTRTAKWIRTESRIRMGTASKRCRRCRRFAMWTGTAGPRSNRAAKRRTTRHQGSSELATCQKTGPRRTYNLTLMFER